MSTRNRYLLPSNGYGTITNKVTISDLHKKVRALPRSQVVSPVWKGSRKGHDSLVVASKLISDDMVGYVGGLIQEKERHANMAPYVKHQVMSTVTETVAQKTQKREK